MKTHAAYSRLLSLYASSALVYAGGIFLYITIPYYRSFLRPETKVVLLLSLALYLLIAPFYYYFYSTEHSVNKPYTALLTLKKSVLRRNTALLLDEKTALLFLLVKFFFIPVMLNFFFINFGALARPTQLLAYAISLIFVIDTLIFVFGYFFEFSFLHNVVKSVEPTFFGWFVALICYPPFNNIAGRYIPSGASEFITVTNPILSFLMQSIVVILLSIYLAGSIALGAKASNLTNRGIVSRFPYSVIRHPAYTAKCLVWWISILPFINTKFFFGMIFWTMIYLFRALTEERHLLADPHYQSYCQKVKYRFIPYIF